MPHIKDIYYFSHDSNASRDPKILEMRSVYGAEGYGWYWMIIEHLREQPGYKLKISPNAIAMHLQCNVDAAVKYLSDCIEKFELFESDGDYFWSGSLIRRMDVVEEKSDKARKAAAARWGKKNKDADAMQTQCGRNAMKLNEIKLKESKSTPPIVLPAHEQKEDDDGNSNNLKNIYKAFSSNIHPITPMEADGLGKWLEDGMEPAVIIWAIKQAVEYGARTTKYINSILTNLYTEGITTLAGAEARERDRQQARMDKPTNGQAREPTPPPPDPEAKKRIQKLNEKIAEMIAMKDLNNNLEGVQTS